MPVKDKTPVKKKYKAKASWSQYAKDWPGNPGKVKVRLPFSDGTKKTIYLTPGEVVETEDWRAKEALENWRPPAITIDGQPWMTVEGMFDDTTDPTDQDLDTL